MRRILAVATAAAITLLSGELSGLEVDFTRSDDDKRVVVRNAGIDAFFSTSGFFTNATSSPKLVFDASGALVWTPHNLYLNSGTPATQAVTIVQGATYTVSVRGSGSIVLAGAAGGTVAQATPITFVATNSSLTSTVSGSLTRMQLNEGATVLPYLATTGAARFAPAMNYDTVTRTWELVCEPTRFNELFPSLAPATQTRSLAAGTYTLWVEGSGSCALSGGPTGTATQGSPVTFTLGGTTSVTFTVTGTLTFSQCEGGTKPTSKILTYTARRPRLADSVSFAFSSIPNVGSDFTVYVEFDYDAPAVSNQYIWSVTETAAVSDLGFRMDALAPVIFARKASVSQPNVSLPSVSGGTGNRVAARLKDNQLLASMNNMPIGLGGQGLTHTMPTATTFFLGTHSGSALQGAAIRLKRMAIIPRGLGPHKIPTWGWRLTPDPTPFDTVALGGQSNGNSGRTINPAIDVSGGHVKQLNQTGALLDAVEPLAHPVPVVDGIGHAVAFARDYYVPLQAGANDVLLLPMNVGNTGFVDNQWNPGDPLFNALLSMIGYSLKKYPASRLRLIRWQQGEKESDVPWTQSQYADSLDTAIAAYRSALAEIDPSLATVPFIVGGMPPQWVAGDAKRQPVQDALAATPGRVARTAYMDPYTPTVINDADGDIAHYDAGSQRGPVAQRTWTAWQSLQ